jgi:hypothetical protein
LNTEYVYSLYYFKVLSSKPMGKGKEERGKRKEERGMRKEERGRRGRARCGSGGAGE